MEEKEMRDRLVQLCVKAYMFGGEQVIIDLPSLIGFVEEELDKAREEGARDVFTKDEWFMLKLAMNDIFNGGNRAYEDISNKIKSQLSKLSKKK